MGNTPSVPEEAEDDNTCTVKSYQPLSKPPDSIKNGSVVFAQNPPPAGNGEGSPAGARRVPVAVAVPAQPGAAGAGGGRSASRALPAARPRSLLAIPWAVPGRCEEPAAAEPARGAPGPGRAPAEGSQHGHHPGPGCAVELAGPPERQHVASPLAKPVTLLDRIFGLEKGKGSARGDPQEGSAVPNGGIAPERVPLGKELDECTPQEPGQDCAGEQAAGRAQVEQDSAQAAAGQGSVMSFLKTLVSPSKSEAKSDSEDKGCKAERGPGGQPGPGAAPASPSKGAKKKAAESPRLGTFSKLFRHKAVKETQQTTNTKSPEQPPAACVKPDRNVPPPQEPPAKPNPKAAEPAAPPAGASPEPAREGPRDKGPATPLPLSKLFWKKNSSEEAEAVSSEKAEAAPEAAAPDRDESKSAESAEVKPRGAESKTPKANLRKFFKLTLNATEKPLAPSASDPGGQRSKEGSKDKRGTEEPGRQRGREQAEPREQPAAQPDPCHNGSDAKEPSRRTEKRQSLGGFFKGLGSKRMSDAEVQTDPVSILPAGKSK